MRARAVLPPLTTALVMIPANNLENMVASLETRVLNPVPAPNPLMTGLPRLHETTAVVSPTTNPLLPMEARNMRDSLTEAGYLAIISQTPMPKARKFESQPDLRLAMLAAMNTVNPTIRSIEEMMAYRETNSRGTVIIFPSEKPSNLSIPTRLLPMANALSLSTMRAGTSSVLEFVVSRLGRREYELTSLKGGLPDIVLRKGLMPCDASTRWSDSRVSTSPRVTTPGYYDTCVTVPSRVSHQASPLLASVYEFLESDQMAWVKEVIAPLSFEKWVARYP